MNTEENTSNTIAEEELGVEKRLADLMMRGWTMLADSCPVESCGCPLMKNLEGQVYCVGCEMWHFDKQRQVKQKFGELVALQGKQNIQIKHTEISKLPHTIDFNFTLSKSVLSSLKLKLVYLSNLLNNENDLNKIQEILETMKICLENIQAAKNI